MCSCNRPNRRADQTAAASAIIARIKDLKLFLNSPAVSPTHDVSPSIVPSAGGSALR
jgi:hypothetical protein